MRVFVPRHHLGHRPELDLSDGLPGVAHPEVPGRVDAVLAGVAAAVSVDRVDVESQALRAVRALHDADYVDFLLELGASLTGATQYLPAMFGSDLREAPLRHRAGMYCREVGTPITAGTVPAALNAASAAEQAARSMVETGEDAMALCRPPGHHAGRRRYGGYCFFNNAYVAVSALRQRFAKVAVVDVDYHLGDGALEFAGEAFPYYSLHADPCANYPYWDRAALQRPHAHLTTFPADVCGAAYLALAATVIDSALAAAPDALVLSLGFDTLGSDGIQDAKTRLVVEDFLGLGRLVARAPCPVLLLLEGGYDVRQLAACSHGFVSGFAPGRS